MAKGSAKKAKHQSFKISPHKHPKDKVMLYVVIAILVGIAIGWFLQEPIISALGGVSTY
jgi:hypothetical protein